MVSTRTGEKHDLDRAEAVKSPEPKRTKETKGRQTTLEETVSRQEGTNTKDEENEPGDQDTKDQSAGKDENGDAKRDQKQDESSAEEKGARGEATPSSILEKGIIYFFLRGRVGIDDPGSVDDVARTYMILRPLAHDAALGPGPIGDAGNSRIIPVPKKVLPRTGRDRFMVFTETVGKSFDDLKAGFLDAADRATKTAGTRHTPAATPVGEGVYALTTTGRESHLAYMLTLPDELGEAQRELGLRERGSFIMSTKNPNYPGPSFAQLPKAPEFPQEILDGFRSLRWHPTRPEHLDYANAQFLLVGESSGIENATEPQKEDEKKGKEEPLEELQQLEDEDTKRMQDLGNDDSQAIYADLEARAKDYPRLLKSLSENR